MWERRRFGVVAASAALVVGIAVGCAGDDADRAHGIGAEAGKPEAQSVGGERPGAAAEEPLLEGAGGLGVSVSADDHVGVVSAERAGEYAVYVTVQNLTGAPLAPRPLSVQLSAFRGEERVDGCEPRARVVEAPASVAAGDAFSVVLPLGCALAEPGDYRIVAVAVAGDEDPSEIEPGTTMGSGAAAIVVDDALPAFGEGGMHPPTEPQRPDRGLAPPDDPALPF